MYIELHARSAFSFLEGACLPEEMAAECEERGIAGMAITDRDGVYGAPRFHSEAVKRKIKSHIGTEITLRQSIRLPLIAASRTGYQNICRLATQMKLRVPKNDPCFTCEEEVARFAEGLICLTGDEGGPLARALEQGGIAEGRRAVERLVETFGRENVYVELQRHYLREEEARNQAAVEIARSLNFLWWQRMGCGTRVRSNARCWTCSLRSVITARSQVPVACSRRIPNGT
jgi:error-prone DNA polymerase